MVRDFDAWIDHLQEEIDRDTRRLYSEKAFRRWKEPSHMGRMEHPDGCARVTGSCGDTMEIYLTVRDGLVDQATAFTDGCGSSMICGSMIAEMAQGRTLEDAMDIRGEDVVAALDGLPQEDVHCAMLAALALGEAVHDHLTRPAGSSDEPAGSGTGCAGDCP